MPSADYVTVDVFTEERFTGNPLAVVVDARDLTARQMQQIATEFNYSESTFVLPPQDPANTARVRIFTPTAEIPFAGHPNVGTAFVIGQLGTLFGKPLGDRLRFEEIAGIVEVDLLRENSAVVGATIRAPKALEIGDDVSPELIGRCASIDGSRVRTQPQKPVIASVGLPFAIAELQDLETLAATKPNLSAFHEAAARHPRQAGDFSLFIYVRNAQDPSQIRARMFAPLDNVQEDPATGSASAALAALLATSDPLRDGEIKLTIEQGVEMGRRSVIELAVAKSDGAVTDVRISGRCVAAMRGTITY
ncbi:PhzF family phenazine biosynthesis protein [Neorhizobium lilium]|uniref:PhzF family phenazine biosynthesis protein n=1 Tax=Neorhizobium lilium TaxID=2503024 RepID=A0A444LJF1_9HYPH|nr:PhzF family phenazine biosynthesis protein [Neorhizobium lilium]RWX79024.1 PhzF family phenazine biosynthesis protein [Neorhizobium lilium]